MTGSGLKERKTGSQTHRSPEPSQVHIKIDVSGASKQAISGNFAELYRQGLSINDIAKQTGKAKSTVRGALMRVGIEFRPNVAAPTASTWRELGKQRIRPPYGFCYFQGQIQPDQKEYGNLLLIHRLWKSGTNPNAIASHLNEKSLPARSAAAWTRNSILNIINRFKGKTVLIKGEHYELR